MDKINLTAVLVDRANYGRLKPLLIDLEKNKQYNLSIIATGTMGLDDYGNVIDELKCDGFKNVELVEMECAGNTNVAVIKSISLGMLGCGEALKRISPDAILTIGDRYEVLAFGIAANFLKIKIIHLQGGEISGCFDDTTRHLMTKLSHLHFVATNQSKKNVLQMGESSKTVFNVGCPSIDDLLKNIKKFDVVDLSNEVNNIGVGDEIDFTKDYLVVLHHPDTLNQNIINEEIISLQKAMSKVDYQIVWFWPNIDPGSNIISKQLRKLRENNELKNIRFIKHLKSSIYGLLLHNAKCLIGNSSSFVRESAILGVPVILIGDRQKGRETSNNVFKVKGNTNEIIKKFKLVIKNKKFKSSSLYGDGSATKKIKKNLPKIIKIKFEKQFCIN